MVSTSYNGPVWFKGMVELVVCMAIVFVPALVSVVVGHNLYIINVVIGLIAVVWMYSKDESNHPNGNMLMLVRAIVYATILTPVASNTPSVMAILVGFKLIGVMLLYKAVVQVYR